MQTKAAAVIAAINLAITPTVSFYLYVSVSVRGCGGGLDMWVKRKDKVYKRHHTKKFGTNRGGQSGQGQSDTDRIKIYKDRQTDRDGQRRTGTERTQRLTATDRNGQICKKRNFHGRTRTDSRQTDRDGHDETGIDRDLTDIRADS